MARPQRRMPCRKLVGGACQYGEGCEYRHLESHQSRVGEGEGEEVVGESGDDGDGVLRRGGGGGGGAGGATGMVAMPSLMVMSSSNSNSASAGGGASTSTSASTPEPTPTIPPLPPTLQKVLGGSLAVTFGAGLAILNLTPLPLTTTTILIDSLPHTTSATQLLPFLLPYHPSLPPSSIHILPKSYNTSRALVHFGAENPAPAEKAARGLDGKTVLGRRLVVRLVRPKNLLPYKTGMEVAWAAARGCARVGVVGGRRRVVEIGEAVGRGLFIRGRRVGLGYEGGAGCLGDCGGGIWGGGGGLVRGRGGPPNTTTQQQTSPPPRSSGEELIPAVIENTYLPHWLHLENLDPYTTASDIRGMLEEATGGRVGAAELPFVEMGRPSYSLSDGEALAYLRRKFEVSREEFKVVSGPSEGRKRAVVTYAEPEEATRVFAKLRREVEMVALLGGGGESRNGKGGQYAEVGDDEMIFEKMGVEFSLTYSATFEISREIFNAVRGEIELLAEMEMNRSVVEMEMEEEGEEANQGNSRGKGKGKGKSPNGGRATSPITTTDPVRIKIIDNPARGPGAIVTVNGSSRKSVASAKSSLQRLLTGIVVLDEDGKPLWDPALRTAEGQELIQQVCELGGVHSHCDPRNRRIRLYGPPEDCKRAEQTLREDYRMLLVKEHEIVLDEKMKRMGTRGGFLAVKLFAGEENVGLDPKGEKLRVKCSPLDIGKVKSLLIQPPSMAHLLKSMSSNTLTTTTNVNNNEGRPAMAEGTCPVCTEPASSPTVKPPCGHIYCRDCLTNYLLSFLDSRRFPILCFHLTHDNNNTPCNTPFPLSLIHHLLPHADADQLYESAFSAHVQSLPSTYSYCPTPDCPTVYTITPLLDDDPPTSTSTTTSSSSTTPSPPQPPIQTCSQCLLGICTTCKTPAHYGQSCHQHQQPSDLEERFQAWKASSGVKDCPRCGTGIQKNQGCNHMSCLCGAHVCWTCMKEFPRDRIYDHMRAECGGSGIAGDLAPGEVPGVGVVVLDERERRAQEVLLRGFEAARRGGGGGGGGNGGPVHVRNGVAGLAGAGQRRRVLLVEEMAHLRGLQMREEELLWRRGGRGGGGGGGRGPVVVGGVLPRQVELAMGNNGDDGPDPCVVM